MKAGTQAHNTLVVGDLHAPFCKGGYLEHCVRAWNEYGCDSVVFIGDVLDNHYASYHETDPDGYSAGEELDRAIDQLGDWVATFPDAVITIGNHDRIVGRKCFSSGVSKRWVRTYQDVLDAPGWNFVEEYFDEATGVLYQHGEGGTARTVAAREQVSTVQGHRHSEAYAWHLANRRQRLWGMQVGCGLDRRSYAAAYARVGPKPAIACAVVADNGRLPIVSMMELGNDF